MRLRLTVILLLSILVIDLITAQSVKLELCSQKEDKCFSSNDPNIRIRSDDYLILKATIINLQNKWMCWDGLSYYFYILSPKLQEGKKWVSASIFNSNNRGNPQFCFSKSSSEENSFFIPLNDYNSIANDSKLGSWEIDSFKFSFTNLKYYNNLKMDSSSSGPDNDFIGNNIRFVIDTEEPKSFWFKGIKSESLKWVIGGINILLGVIAGGLWIHIFTTNKKTKPWILTIILTLISLVLAYFGFTS